MSLKSLRITVGTCCLLILLPLGNANADDWIRRTFDVAPKKQGVITFEYPDYWGKKPEYKKFDNITEFAFGPFGPRSKPLLRIQLQSVLWADAITEDQLKEITDGEVTLVSDVAFESEIVVNELSGPHNTIRYFSISDKEKKWGEFDYLTLAVIASGNLLTKSYFFSSDGAPDFGADAIRMMESIKYTPPPADPDKKKDK